MDKQYDEVLQQKLRDYVAKAGSQAKAAKEIGYSGAVLSCYLKGEYAGNVKAIEDKIREFLEIKEEAAHLYTGQGYVPTSISRGVYSTIRMCHLKGGLANECGDAGIGKTKAALKYVEDYPNQAIYVSVNPCLSSVTAFFKLLCRKLKIDVARKDDMWMEVDDHLRGGRKVLIVDEAQHLPIKTVEAIRALTDSNTELGVVMIGNPETINVGHNRPAFAQIRNRTKLINIRHTTEITTEDIALLFPDLEGQTKEIDFLLTIARSEQGVRGTANLYSNAHDNEDITYDGLVAMAKAMKIITY